MAFKTPPQQDDTLGVYIHWPFCASKCPYCDFNSHVRRQIDEEVFVQALKTELETTAQMTGRKHVRSIFFGGGTPSLMHPWMVDSVLQTVFRLYDVLPDCEITLEANPTSVEAEKFKGYAAAGVNRLSMGIQALDDDSLKSLGRLHSVAEAMKAFDVAKSCFQRVSFDLIYARMGQSLAEWEKELKQACEMAVSHLSLYQLTIEEGTRFADLYKRGKIILPPDDVAASFYEVTQTITAEYGYHAYEVSNYARTGDEGQHNLGYWRYQPYIGVGAGSHGRFFNMNKNGEKEMLATQTVRNPEAWCKAVQEQGQGYLPFETVTADEQGDEMVLMGLRLKEGISISRYQAITGHSLNMNKIKTLCEQGFLHCNNDMLTATNEGRWVLNTILSEILN